MTHEGTSAESENSSQKNTQNPDNGDAAGSRTADSQKKNEACDGQEYTHLNSEKPKWWHRIDWSQVVLDTLPLIVGIRLVCIYTGQLNQMIQQMLR